jgi:hypothetical protein
MSRSTRFHRMFPAAIVIAAVAAFLVPMAQATQPPVPDVPADIQVPVGNTLFLVAHATGVQIYTCTAAGWTFVAPRADLFDDHGKLIITHFAGPTWQAKDGSQAVGTVEKKVTPDLTAVAWLRLKAATTPGLLGRTTYIQRIATAGGIAPVAATCTAANLNEISEVPYTADYTFWKKQQAQAD